MKQLNPIIMGRVAKPIGSASHTSEALSHSGTECSRGIGGKYSALSDSTTPRTSVPATGLAGVSLR